MFLSRDLIKQRFQSDKLHHPTFFNKFAIISSHLFWINFSLSLPLSTSPMPWLGGQLKPPGVSSSHADNQWSHKNQSLKKRKKSRHIMGGATGEKSRHCATNTRTNKRTLWDCKRSVVRHDFLKMQLFSGCWMTHTCTHTCATLCCRSFNTKVGRG